MADPPSRAARAAHALGAAAFLACAAVQLNDPDPARWVALYGLAAGACAMGAAGRRVAPLAGGLAGIAVAWAVLVAIDFARSSEGWTDELARELGGLALVVVWMAALVWPRARGGLRGGVDRAK